MLGVGVEIFLAFDAIINYMKLDSYGFFKYQFLCGAF